MDELQYLEKYLKYKQKYYELEHGGMSNLINKAKSTLSTNPSSPLNRGVEQSQKIVKKNVSANTEENKRIVAAQLKLASTKFSVNELKDVLDLPSILSSATFTKSKGVIDEKKAIKRIIGAMLVHVSTQLLKMIKDFYQDEEIKRIIMNKDISSDDKELLGNLDIPLLYKIAINFITYCYNLKNYLINGLIGNQDNGYSIKDGKEGKQNYNNLETELKTLIEGVLERDSNTGKDTIKKGLIITYNNEEDKYYYYPQDVLKALISKLLIALQEYKNKDYKKVSENVKTFLGFFANLETKKIETADKQQKNIHELNTISDLRTFLESIKKELEDNISKELLSLEEYQKLNKFSARINTFKSTVETFTSLVRCSVTLGLMKFSDVYDSHQRLYLPELEKIESIYQEAMTINTNLKELLKHSNMKLTPEQENLVETINQELAVAKDKNARTSILNRLFNSKLSLKQLLRIQSFDEKEEFNSQGDTDDLDTSNMDKETREVFEEGRKRGNFTGAMMNSLLNSAWANTVEGATHLYNIVTKKVPRPPTPLASQLSELPVN